MNSRTLEIVNLLSRLIIVVLILCSKHDLMIIWIGHCDKTHPGANFDLVWYRDYAVPFHHLEVTVDILDEKIVANATAVNLIWFFCGSEANPNPRLDNFRVLRRIRLLPIACSGICLVVVEVVEIKTKRLVKCSAPANICYLKNC